jgi:TatD DNase family protein
MLEGNNMSFSDSHCHLTGQWNGHIAKILEQAKLKGVAIIVGCGGSLESSKETINIAQSNQGVLASVGIHPCEAVVPTIEICRHFEKLVRFENVVAIGEIGLDYIHNPQTKEIQRELFIYELSLARETGLPVNIHCNGAHQDMIDILRQDRSSGLGGVIHGFSGDQEELKDWLKLGFYISIGTAVFFTDHIPWFETTIRDIPLDLLLSETDANRRSGSPADVISVVEKLAFIRGTSSDIIANATTNNLRRLLQLH